MGDADHILFDDRSFIQILGHVMRGGSDQLDAFFKRLPIRYSSLEAWQKRVVNVDNPP